MLGPRARANREMTTMDFGKVLTKEFLLNWKGRVNRAQFWAFVLLYIAGAIAIAIVDGILGTGGILGFIYALAALYPYFCVLIRRWHDRDKSGLFCLVILIPFLGALWILIECGCLKGTDGPNRFGPDPLAPVAV
jgi:uncharacterized membrane protein YhaH (DUF805 family)